MEPKLNYDRNHRILYDDRWVNDRLVIKDFCLMSDHDLIIAAIP